MVESQARRSLAGEHCICRLCSRSNPTGKKVRRSKPCDIRRSKPCDFRRSKPCDAELAHAFVCPSRASREISHCAFSSPHRWACRRCPTAIMHSGPGNTFPYLCLCMITHAYIHTHKEQVVALAGRSLTRMKGGAWHSQLSSRPARHGVVRLGAWAFR